MGRYCETCKLWISPFETTCSRCNAEIEDIEKYKHEFLSMPDLYALLVAEKGFTMKAKFAMDRSFQDDDFEQKMKENKYFKSFLKTYSMKIRGTGLIFVLYSYMPHKTLCTLMAKYLAFIS